MIVASWVMSTVISVPPLFGLEDHSFQTTNNQSVLYNRQPLTTPEPPPDDLWVFDKQDLGGAFMGEDYGYSDYYEVLTYDATYEEEANDTLLSELDCIISQNLGYTVFSTVGAFYLPLIFIVAVYLNVYRVARSRIHRRQFNRRREDDRPGAQRDASTIDPDDTTQTPGVVWQALRSRLNTFSSTVASSL